MSQSASTAFWSSWTGSRPSLSAFPRKMSPNRAAMTTLKPQSRSAQTACCRDEPVPKLGPATRIVAPAWAGLLSTNDGSSRQALNRPSSKPVRVTRFRYTAGMIWSVSTSERRRGMTLPLWVTNLSIWSLPLQVGRVKVSWCSEPAHHRGGCGDLRRDQVRTPALALPALEVAVGRGGGALAGTERVRVHPQAHRAAGEAPLGARVGEDLVQTLGLGGLAHLVGARHDHHA